MTAASFHTFEALFPISANTFNLNTTASNDFVGELLSFDLSSTVWRAPATAAAPVWTISTVQKRTVIFPCSWISPLASAPSSFNMISGKKISVSDVKNIMNTLTLFVFPHISKSHDVHRNLAQQLRLENGCIMFGSNMDDRRRRNSAGSTALLARLCRKREADAHNVNSSFQNGFDVRLIDLVRAVNVSTSTLMYGFGSLSDWPYIAALTTNG
jgi:hypothetical protein